ncbi:MAG: thioredoxin family protein [Staphylococcus sp.]|nr:thioredoxin family protein [Staphylococcus sp.]
MTYNDVINSSPVVFVEFYASWCPHCHKMMPVVEQIKELLEGRVPVYQFDIDKNSDAADEAGIRSIPVFIIYRNGKEEWRHTGETDGEVLLSKIESYL